MSLVNSDAVRGRGGGAVAAGAGVPTPMITTTSNDTGPSRPQVPLSDDLERLEQLERAFTALRDELIRLQVIEG